MSNRINTFVISVVTVVWALNLLAPLKIQGYKPSPYVNGAFMLVVGAVCYAYRNEVRRKPSPAPPPVKPAKPAKPKKRTPAKRAPTKKRGRTKT